MSNNRRSSLLITLLLSVCLAPQANAQVREFFESLFADDEEEIAPAEAIAESSCPETVSFFDGAQKFPGSCGAVVPPQVPGSPPDSLKIYEGVWDVRLEGKDEVVEWVGVLSKGMGVVGQRAPNAEWSIFGAWSAAYDSGVVPFLRNLGGRVDSISAGALRANVSGYEITVHPNGSTSLVGRWKYRDTNGMAVWSRRPQAQISELIYNSNRADEAGNRIISRVRPGEVGRLEFNHPVTCGYGHMRGNCHNIYISVYGWPMGAPLDVWLDPVSHLEHLQSRFVYEGGDKAPEANYSMGSSIVARGLIDHMQLQFVAWDGMTPGKQVLWIDGQAYPFDIVIHGYPEETEPEPRAKRRSESHSDCPEPP